MDHFSRELLTGKKEKAGGFFSGERSWVKDAEFYSRAVTPPQKQGFSGWETMRDLQHTRNSLLVTIPSLLESA